MNLNDVLSSLNFQYIFSTALIVFLINFIGGMFLSFIINMDIKFLQKWIRGWIYFILGYTFILLFVSLNMALGVLIGCLSAIGLVYKITQLCLFH